jgi:hypothetical protein
MSDSGYHDLKIGESVRIKHGFLTNISLVYAGMPSDSTFSLAVTMASGNIGMGYNLYFPVNHRLFELAGASITVQTVSPAAVQLTVR